MKFPIRSSRWVGSLLLFASVFTGTLCAGNAPLTRWSEPDMTTAANGRRVHGPFGNQPVSVTLGNLPAHQWVLITCDLTITGSWDGSSPVWGPDIWSLSVRGGQRLVFATFCGLDYSNNNTQSYPDDLGSALHPSWTGCISRVRPVVSATDPDPLPAGVYRVDVLFPHTGSQLVLDLAGSYQDPVSEKQSWSTSNLQVRTSNEDTLTNPADLPQLWDDLGGNNVAKANAAIWKFIGAGSEGMEFIREQISHIPQDDSVTEADGIRLHRAQRIVRIIGGEGASALCFYIDHLFPEYARQLTGK